MNLKRTMGEALRNGKLSEEALGFLNPGNSEPKAEPEPPTAVAPLVVARTAPVPSEPPAKEPMPTVQTLRDAPPVETPLQPVTASMTFRLATGLHAGLIRASADRKLRRQRPCSQQDIVAEALQLWLKTQGYSSTG